MPVLSGADGVLAGLCRREFVVDEGARAAPADGVGAASAVGVFRVDAQDDGVSAAPADGVCETLANGVCAALAGDVCAGPAEGGPEVEDGSAVAVTDDAQPRAIVI